MNTATSEETFSIEYRDAAVKDWLKSRNLADPAHPDFALTPCTRRLRISGTEGADDPTSRMFVTAVALPNPPWQNLWKASDSTVYAWLKEPSRRYAPFQEYTVFPSDPKPMVGGILFEEPDHRSGRYLRQYLAIQRTGVIELGLGTVCISRQTEKGYLLTPTIAHIWHLLGFASDLYQRVGQKRPFTLIVNLRETEGALLGGLGKGWLQPWGSSDWKPICVEPHIQIRHDQLGPVIDTENAERIATEVAFDIEAGWGHGGNPKFFPRCFSRNPDESKGAFDLSVIRF